MANERVASGFVDNDGANERVARDFVDNDGANERVASGFIDNEGSKALNRHSITSLEDNLLISDHFENDLTRAAPSRNRYDNLSRLLIGSNVTDKSHDVVDMIVNKNEEPQEDEVKMCIVSDYNNFPPYTKCQVFMNVFSIVLFILDIVTDSLLALSFYSRRLWTYFWLTVAFMAVPSLVMNAYSLLRYLMDDERPRRRVRCTDRPPPMFGLRRVSVAVLHVSFTILQLDPVLRYASAIYYGLKSRNQEPDESDRRKMYEKCRQEEVLSRKLRLFETAMEAGPQLVLQLYILLHVSHQPNDDIKQGSLLYITGVYGYNETIVVLLSTASILTSWAGISWAHVSYHRAATHVHDRHITPAATVIYFLWRVFEIGPRVLALSVFGEVFSFYVVVVMFVHWMAMLIWYMTQRRVSTEYRVFVNIHTVLNNMASAAVSTFGYFDIKSGGLSRYRHAVFYMFFYTENIVMASVWFCYTRHRQEWFQIPILVFVGLGMLLSFSLQLAYFVCHRESS